MTGLYTVLECDTETVGIHVIFEGIVTMVGLVHLYTNPYPVVYMMNMI